MTDITGGPAFPQRTMTHMNVDESGSASPIYQDAPGMTLRDWFAGQALAGSLAGEPGSHLITERLAPECYAIADAMLAARSKT